MPTKMLLGSASALAAAISLATPATAQDTQGAAPEAAADDSGLRDIIVTATRRETNLQDTPIAVSALDATTIAQASPRDIRDIASFVPNFSAETITGFNAASFAMRGVGQNNIIVYFEPPVVVLVDDFVVPSVQTQLLDTFDLQQIEVLRGPQGTLFGKNSTGGAVTVRTKRPVMNEIGIEARAEYGSFGTTRVQGAANVPIIDDVLSLRLVGGYQYSDGYYKNGACYGPVNNLGVIPSKFDGVSGCLDGEDIGGQDVWSARAKLLFEPTANISALLQYEWIRDRSEAVPSVNENSIYTGNVGFLTDFLNTGSFNPNSDDPLDNAGITNRNDALMEMEKGQRIDVDGIYLNVDFDFEFGTLTSVSGYRKQKSRLPNSYSGHAPIAADGQPLSIFDARRDDDRKTWQQEVRFATDTGGPFDAVFGGFYQKDNADFCVSQVLGFLDLTAATPDAFADWNNTPFVLCNAQKAKSKALFAEGTFEFTPDLKLTAGIRHTWEDKVWRGRQQVFAAQLNGGFDPSITLNQPLDASIYNYTANVIRLEAKAREFTYRASLGYQAAPDVFVYGTYSRGFKGGGFNDQIGGFAPFQDNLALFRAQARATEPETADSFEVGMKSEWLDRRLRFNLTGFFVKYKDLQKQLNVPIVVNGQPNQVTVFFNAASAEVKGLELETSARITDSFTLRGVLGYQDAKYNDYDAPGAGYDLSSAPLDRAPKWQWSADALYELPIGDNMSLTLNGNIAYTSRNLFTQSITDPAGNTFLNARTLLNASITLAQVDNDYYVRLIGRNLTDERYRTASQNVAGLWLNSQYGPPRYFGVEVGFNFGSAR